MGVRTRSILRKVGLGLSGLVPAGRWTTGSERGRQCRCVFAVIRTIVLMSVFAVELLDILREDGLLHLQPGGWGLRFEAEVGSYRVEGQT